MDDLGQTIAWLGKAIRENAPRRPAVWARE
jgi:hypothetical protein